MQLKIQLVNKLNKRDIILRYIDIFKKPEEVANLSSFLNVLKKIQDKDLLEEATKDRPHSNYKFDKLLEYHIKCYKQDFTILVVV